MAFQILIELVNLEITVANIAMYHLLNNIFTHCMSFILHIGLLKDNKAHSQKHLELNPISTHSVAKRSSCLSIFLVLFFFTNRRRE